MGRRSKKVHSWAWNDHLCDLLCDLISWSLDIVIITTILPSTKVYYRQASGLPMGYSLSPWAACVTLWAQCELPAQQAIRAQTWMYGRYIDNIFLLTRPDSTLRSTEDVSHWLKTIYTDRMQSIRLTVSSGAGTRSVPFLNLNIETDEDGSIVGKMCTVCYSKSTSTFQYLEQTSLHPQQIFKATVQQEAARMMDTTSRMDRLQQMLEDVSIRYSYPFMP